MYLNYNHELEIKYYTLRHSPVPTLLGLVVLVPQLALVDGEGLLLTRQGRPEVTHAALGPGHEVVGHSHLVGGESLSFIKMETMWKCIYIKMKLV